MKKAFIFTFLVFLLSACGSTTANTATISESVKITTPTLELAPSTEASTATQTLTPTAEPTPAPVLFDQAGFQQFAITHSYFQGFLDFKNEKSFTQMASSLSPDGRMIAIAGCWGSMNNLWKCENEKSGFLIIFNVDTGELLANIPLGKGWPGNVVFNPSSSTVFYSTHERIVSSWDLENNQAGLTFFNVPATGTTLFPDIAVSPDGSNLSAVVDDTLYIWNMEGNLIKQLPADQGRLNAALSYSADGTLLTVYSPDAFGLDIYETETWTLVQRFNQDDITGGLISPDGLTVATIGDYNKKIIIWDVISGEKLMDIDPEIQMRSISFNPQGDLLVLTGMGNLENPDDYDAVGVVYETKTWTKISNLYSFIGDGNIEFAANGSRMAILSDGLSTVWEAPDDELNAGYEIVKQFQSALAEGDYIKAASFFEVDENELNYLVDVGLDPDNLASSLEKLCIQQTIFCYPVKELVMMGRDWYDQAYLVKLETLSGETFTSPAGAQIIHLYTRVTAEGDLKIIFLPMDF